MTPVVSVAIRAFRRNFLGEAIKSVLRQTHTDFELIIYDDAGDLEDVAAAFADPRIRYYRAARRTGPSGRFNAAVAFCQGQFIAVLDDDDRYEARFLERMISALERNPDAGAAFCRAAWAPGAPRRPPPPDAGGVSRHEAPSRWRASPSTLLLRRTALQAADAIQPMPDDVAPDIFVNFRIAAAGWSHVLVDEILVERTWHASQLSRAGVAALDLAVTSYQRLHLEDAATDAIRRRALAAYHVARATHWLEAGRRDLARSDIRAAGVTDAASQRFRRLFLKVAAGSPGFGPGTVRLARALRASFTGGARGLF